MSNINPDTDLVILPVKGLRGKRHHLIGKGNLLAIVNLGFSYRGNQPEYTHPSVVLTVERGDEWSDTTLCELSFQRNRLGMSEYDSASPDYLQSGDGSVWCQTYAANVTARLERADYLAVGLELIARAHEALPSFSDDPDVVAAKAVANRCELSKLIEGFKRIGVRVVIRHGKVYAEDRATRAAKEAQITAVENDLNYNAVALAQETAA